VVGLLVLFATTMGRWICGFLCPFGLLQDLVYKVNTRKLTLGKKLGFLKYLKYAILVIMVILLPSLLVNQYGNGAPYFCAYLCPSGTFFAAFPLLIANPTIIVPQISWQFWYKVWILIAILVASVFIYRFFCKVLCPLGAFYGLFNRISFVRLELEKHKCVDCGACKKACKMEIDPKETPNNTECIRCMDCVKSCKFDALTRTKLFIKNEETASAN
jgi:polyferredoxin